MKNNIEKIKKVFKSKSPFKTVNKEIKLTLGELYLKKKLSQARIVKIFGV